MPVNPNFRKQGYGEMPHRFGMNRTVYLANGNIAHVVFPYEFVTLHGYGFGGRTHRQGLVRQKDRFLARPLEGTGEDASHTRRDS